jgi:hypothetical protein
MEMETVPQVLPPRSAASVDLTQLPNWLKALLDSCPCAGDGVHFWIFRVARHLLAHFDQVGCFELIKAKATGCGRPQRKLEAEIASQIRNAQARMWRPEDPVAWERRTGVCPPDVSVPLPPPAPPWPQPDIEQIGVIVERGFGLVDLFERSPIRFDDEQVSRAEEIIDILFPDDPLLCLGKSRATFATQRREVWRGHLHELPLVVPNPMLDYLGRTAEGHFSEHTKANTARRTYLVAEFDFAEFGRDGKTPSCWAPLVRGWQDRGVTVADGSAALLWCLAERLPLVCITHSGNKSLHGWYQVFGQSENALREFMAYAVKLGADPATWTRSQFVRLPSGLRENGRRQLCYYLDPSNALSNTYENAWRPRRERRPL